MVLTTQFSKYRYFHVASHNENFGNVYLESLASGTPITLQKIPLGKMLLNLVVTM